LLTNRKTISQWGIALLLAGLAACGGAESAKLSNSLIADSLARFQSLQDAPQSSSPALQKAKEAMARGDSFAVGQFLRQEQARNPQSVELGFLMSQMMFQNAAWAAALPGFEKVIQVVPSFEGAEFAFYFYGCCSMRLGKADIAKESLLAHLELKPQHADTLLALGQLSVKNGRGSEALQFLKKIQEGAPNINSNFRAQIFSCKGEAWLQLSDLQKAKSALEESLALNPKQSETHYILYRVLTRLGDKEGAQRERLAFEGLK
jgi:tetratricopeptide (TPR) repeat protein